MIFDELGRFEKIQDPEPRKAEEIKRKPGKDKKHSTDYSKSRKIGSVSVKTVQRSNRLLVALIWLTVLLVVGYGVYRVLGAFTNG